MTTTFVSTARHGWWGEDQALERVTLIRIRPLGRAPSGCLEPTSTEVARASLRAWSPESGAPAF